MTLLLHTDRLVIRNFTAEDGQDLHEYLSQEQVLRYEPDDVSNLEACRRMAVERARSDIFLAVELQETETGKRAKMIGHLYMNPVPPDEFATWELGYIFNPHFYGKGYATEACQKILRHAFEECAAHRVMAMCNPENLASWKLLERIGMRREGHHRQKAFFDRDAQGQPIWHDAYHYAVLAEEWPLRQHS